LAASGGAQASADVAAGPGVTSRQAARSRAVPVRADAPPTAGKHSEPAAFTARSRGSQGAGCRTLGVRTACSTIAPSKTTAPIAPSAGSNGLTTRVHHHTVQMATSHSVTCCPGSQMGTSTVPPQRLLQQGCVRTVSRERSLSGSTCAQSHLVLQHRCARSTSPQGQVAGAARQVPAHSAAVAPASVCDLLSPARAAGSAHPAMIPGFARLTRRSTAVTTSPSHGSPERASSPPLAVKPGILHVTPQPDLRHGRARTVSPERSASFIQPMTLVATLGQQQQPAMQTRYVCNLSPRRAHSGRPHSAGRSHEVAKQQRLASPPGDRAAAGAAASLETSPRTSLSRSLVSAPSSCPGTGSQGSSSRFVLVPSLPAVANQGARAGRDGGSDLVRVCSG